MLRMLHAAELVLPPLLENLDKLDSRIERVPKISICILQVSETQCECRALFHSGELHCTCTLLLYIDKCTCTLTHSHPAICSSHRLYVLHMLHMYLHLDFLHPPYRTYTSLPSPPTKSLSTSVSRSCTVQYILSLRFS